MPVRESALYRLPITEWPESERPREKLMQQGPHRLTDTELIAILLRSGTGGHSAIETARELIVKAGSLQQLAQMDYNEILHLKVKGVGKTKAVTIAAALQLARRLQSANHQIPDQIVHSSNDVALIYGPRLRDLKKEIFMVIMLASNNKIIKDAQISEGILNASVVTPREVFRAALLTSAAAVILIHNHPSGNPEPSREDIQLTHQMVTVGQAMNIPVLDHLIIAGDKYTSFADKGLL